LQICTLRTEAKRFTPRSRKQVSTRLTVSMARDKVIGDVMARWQKDDTAFLTRMSVHHLQEEGADSLQGSGSSYQRRAPFRPQR
jgi:hypothetical protein